MALSASTPPASMMIDPTKQGEYPIILGDKLAKRSGADGNKYINITYNHKSKSATAHQRTKITRSPTSPDVYNLTITDKAGNAEQTTLEYRYKGSIDPEFAVQGSEARNLVLVFDPSRKAFILEPVSANINFNLRAAPGKNREVIEQYEQLHTLGDDADQASRAESDDEKPEDADQDNPYDFRHFLKHADSQKTKTTLSSTTTPDPHSNFSTANTPASQPIIKVEAKKVAPRPKQQTNPLRQPKRAPKAHSATTTATSGKAKAQPQPAVRVEAEVDDFVLTDGERAEKDGDDIHQPSAGQAVASPGSNIIVDGDLIIDMGSPPARSAFQVDPTHFSSSDHSIIGTDAEDNGDDDEELEGFRLPSPARPAASEDPEAAEDNEDDEFEDALAAEMEAAFEEEEASRTQTLQQSQRYVPSDDESEVSEEE